MNWKSVIWVSLFVLISLLLVSTTEAKKKRKFDGDFEFADEEETKVNRKEGKKTWILDPGSDLCQALKCKKKELCLLEDEFTAVCVSKKELHKNGDVIVPKSKLKETSSATKSDDEGNSKEDYEEDEDDDSDYYDEDEDSNEDLFPSSLNNQNSNNNNVDKSSSSNMLSPSSSSSMFQQQQNSQQQQDANFKTCTPCPVVKPTFLCGSDNRTYSTLCRLDYHNCIQNTQTTVVCKGFCPCKEISEETPKKKTYDAEKVSKFMQKYKKTVANLKMQQQQKLAGKKVSKVASDDTKMNEVFSSNDFASGVPLASSVQSKDRYSKYKEFYGSKAIKTSWDKQKSYNDVINTKPTSGRECNAEALESMGNRLLDWFSVVMADTQKRKSIRKNRITQGDHFPGDCKREVQWMFTHLNSDEDGQLSLQELFDLENDRNEKCIKPFLDRCDSDKDIFISPREWCNCFGKSNPFSGRASSNNVLDDDEDSDVEGSSDGPLEI